jgi:hypothetical protein
MVGVASEINGRAGQAGTASHGGRRKRAPWISLVRGGPKEGLSASLGRARSMQLRSRSAVAARPPTSENDPSSRPRAKVSGRLVGRKESPQVKKALLPAAVIVAAIAFVLPATSMAATFRGVVIAKDSARKSLVTASRNGVVITVRARAAFKRVHVGRLVAVKAAALPDGTYAASKLRMLGKSRHVHFRGTVVSAKGQRLVLSAGHSVFSLRVRGGKTAASEGASDLQPGDDVDGDGRCKGGSLETRRDHLKKVGRSDELVLEGIYLGTSDDGTIELAVVHKGRVFVHVPDGVDVPELQPGDEVALVVKVEDDNSFTLVEAENESSPSDDDDGDDVHMNNPGAEFSVVGLLAAVSDESVAVKVEGRDEPVRCAVPDGFDLTGFETGQRVFMSCRYRDGHPVLLALKKKDAESQYRTAGGAILDFADGGITVKGDGAHIWCAVPDSLDLFEFEVGDLVMIKCMKVEGVWTLKAITKKPPPLLPPPQYVLATGTITDLSADSITVQGEHEPVTCAVPEGADLSDFAVDDTVSIKCFHTELGLRLVRLKSETALYEAS